MRPPNSFPEPSIEEWRYTIPLAPAVPAARVATESAFNAAPPRVAPIHRAPVVAAPPVAAPPLMPIPGLVPGALLEPLFPPADMEPVFGAITLGTESIYRWFYHRLSWPLASCPASPIHRPRSARPRFCCRNCFGGNAPGASGGVSRREQVV
jgi:hypothetical protein